MTDQLELAKAMQSSLADAQAKLTDAKRQADTLVSQLSEPSPPTIPPDPQPVVFTPKALPTSTILSNQGCGWQTYHANANQRGRPSSVPSRSMYARDVWNSLEPKIGQNGGQLDAWIAQAAATGQLFATRVQTWSDNDPGPADYKALPGWDVTHYGRKHWQPDLDNSAVRLHVERFVGRLAASLDDAAVCDFFDIGYFGPWGEWSETNNTKPNLPWPSRDACKWLVDLHVGVFRNIPIVVNAFMGGVGGALEYAFSKGCGYRGDSWGDNGAGGYNHRYLYEPTLAKYPDVWRSAPIVMETWYDMSSWAQRGGNPQAALDFARDKHVGYIHNKFGVVPSNLEQPVRDLMAGMGFRIRIKTLALNEDRTQATVTIVNSGRSPCYLRDRVLTLHVGTKLVELAKLAAIPPGELTKRIEIPRSPGAALSVSVQGNSPSTRNYHELDQEGRFENGQYFLGIIPE